MMNLGSTIKKTNRKCPSINFDKNDYEAMLELIGDILNDEDNMIKYSTLP